jgi:hypothetical protein
MLYVFKPVQMQVSAVFIQREYPNRSRGLELFAYFQDSVNIHIRRGMG